MRVLLGVYLVASIVTFVVYRADKWAAQRNARRTPEVTMHVLALIGGWPGALLAQRMLRHKCRKPGFQTVFWTTVVLNCAVTGWLWSAGSYR